MLRNNCLSCAIRDRAICQALPDAALVQLNQMARRRTVKAGQRIFEDGADVPMVANIVSGVVRLSKSLADGRTQIVGLMFPCRDGRADELRKPAFRKITFSSSPKVDVMRKAFRAFRKCFAIDGENS
jgi:CRP/FNR family transcriptional regulator